MFISQFLVAAVLAATRIRVASAFQAGSDYGVYPAHSLYNCTGQTPVSNLTVRNPIDSLPQIDPSSAQGWEQWALVLHGTPQMILRWNKGDASSNESSLSHFDLVASVNNTIIQNTTVTGKLSYVNDGGIKQITIGGASLTWSEAALWFNASVDLDGYKLEMDSYSATMDTFHPNIGSHNGMLNNTGGWYASVPVVRGHVTGNFVTPSANITVDGLSSLRHMFSENPLPTYIKKYLGGTVFGYSTTFYDSYQFYQLETTDDTVRNTAYLGRAFPLQGATGLFSSAWATYVVSDDNLYTPTFDNDTINASFAGCDSTKDIPFEFNVTSMTLFAQYAEVGGVTRYHVISGTTSAPFNGAVAKGTIQGFVEEYIALHQ